MELMKKKIGKLNEDLTTGLEQVPNENTDNLDEPKIEVTVVKICGKICGIPASVHKAESMLTEVQPDVQGR